MSDKPPRGKTGPRPKTLKTGTYQGLEIGRGERKRIVDPEEVQKLAAIGMKNSEIADWFDVDDSTLRTNFQRELQKGRLELQMSLRRAQIKYALAGSNPLLIFLGKNLLGQSDQPNQTQIDNQILPWITTEGHKDESNP